ncbi:unnamed protein product [Microthlaspi erraticum]|uniref:DUF1985 domain-containing protein n=1 Tax=Microthlaspi erraticum TaxID=1685480 RepID=A0A6D2ILF0_9BRAS|nr:unnamed protein product [Microthlaspi erraticum]
MMARKIDNLHNSRSRKKFLNRIKPPEEPLQPEQTEDAEAMPSDAHVSSFAPVMLVLIVTENYGLWLMEYSIKEHALLSGLDCHDYPSNYGELKDKEAGDFKFVEKWFKRRTNITIADVKKKLGKVKSAVNKKKMAALYFLTNVLKAKSK